MHKGSSYIELLVAFVLLIGIFTVSTHTLYQFNNYQNLINKQNYTISQINILLNRLTFEIKSSPKIITRDFPANSLTYLNSTYETKTIQTKKERLARIGIGTSYLTNKNIRVDLFTVTQPKPDIFKLKLVVAIGKKQQTFTRSIRIIND